MAKKFLILFTFSVSFSFVGHSQTYKLDTLRTEYQELETYISIAIEVEGVLDWEKKLVAFYVSSFGDFCNVTWTKKKSSVTHGGMNGKWIHLNE